MCWPRFERTRLPAAPVTVLRKSTGRCPHQAPREQTMAAEYIYRVAAWWTSGRTGLAKCESAPNTVHFSEAAELGGLQGRWTPEQLLLCALAGCFTTTFHEVARVAKFEYTDLEVEIEGSVHRTRNT